MQTMNRWRNWKPSQSSVPNTAAAEVPHATSGTFDTSESNKVADFSTRRFAPVADSSAWMEDFHSWAMSHCVFRDRSFGGIGCLHLHFCEWAMSDRVPCTREVFESLLRVNGFETADGLVYGLLLKGDEASSSERSAGR